MGGSAIRGAGPGSGHRPRVMGRPPAATGTPRRRHDRVAEPAASMHRRVVNATTRRQAEAACRVDRSWAGEPDTCSLGRSLRGRLTGLRPGNPTPTRNRASQWYVDRPLGRVGVVPESRRARAPGGGGAPSLSPGSRLLRHEGTKSPEVGSVRRVSGASRWARRAPGVLPAFPGVVSPFGQISTWDPISTTRLGGRWKKVVAPVSFRDSTVKSRARQMFMGGFGSAIRCSRPRK